MELRRRFIFRGNAAAFGGRFVRPDDVTLTMKGASCLPVVGGRSEATLDGKDHDFKGYFSFRSARTLAEGKFDDRDQAIELTHGRVAEDAVPTSTIVRAEIDGVTIGTEKRLTVERMVAELRSSSPKGRSEPPIPVGEVEIRGLSIDGFRLRVVFDTTAFNDHDTHAKLLRALTPAFAKKFGDQFYMKEKVAGFPPPGAGRLIPHRRLIHATLVKRVEWESGANPRARIVRNRFVIVENFGKIFFGEILISPGARRLTLMRLELGSDGGGQAGGPDVDTNGGYSP